MSNYNPFSLAGKTIFITGASSGIGKSIAIECSKMGGTMIISGRNTERLNETFEQLDGNGHRQIAADLNNDDDVERIISSLPKLDGVVHCAGIVQSVPFQFTNEAMVENIMSINFTAPVIVSAKLTKKKVLNKGCSVVFISSISGVFRTAALGSSVYSASKGAINGIMKGMALDLAHKGIRVNSVNPGMVESSILDAGVVTTEQLEEDKKNYPLGKRYGKPEEVAYAVIYLLSDASSWVTGSAMLIDGGFTL